MKQRGPYAEGAEVLRDQNNITLVWVVQSSRWKPHWRAGITDFQSDFADGWWYGPDGEQDWRQRMLEAIVICQCTTADARAWQYRRHSATSPKLASYFGETYLSRVTLSGAGS